MEYLFKVHRGNEWSYGYVFVLNPRQFDNRVTFFILDSFFPSVPTDSFEETTTQDRHNPSVENHSCGHQELSSLHSLTPSPLPSSERFTSTPPRFRTQSHSSFLDVEERSSPLTPPADTIPPSPLLANLVSNAVGSHLATTQLSPSPTPDFSFTRKRKDVSPSRSTRHSSVNRCLRPRTLSLASLEDVEYALTQNVEDSPEGSLGRQPLSLSQIPPANSTSSEKSHLSLRSQTPNTTKKCAFSNERVRPSLENDKSSTNRPTSQSMGPVSGSSTNLYEPDQPGLHPLPPRSTLPLPRNICSRPLKVPEPEAGLRLRSRSKTPAPPSAAPPVTAKTSRSRSKTPSSVNSRKARLDSFPPVREEVEGSEREPTGPPLRRSSRTRSRSRGRPTTLHVMQQPESINPQSCMLFVIEVIQMSLD